MQLDLDEVVMLLPRGFVGQLVCELMMASCKLLICLIVAPEERLQPSFNVVLDLGQRFASFLLLFIFGLVILSFGRVLSIKISKTIVGLQSRLDSGRRFKIFLEKESI